MTILVCVFESERRVPVRHSQSRFESFFFFFFGFCLFAMRSEFFPECGLAYLLLSFKGTKEYFLPISEFPGQLQKDRPYFMICGVDRAFLRNFFLDLPLRL